MRAGREVVAVAAVRTPIGRGHPAKGAFAPLHALDLLAPCFAEGVRRAGIDPAQVDDVICGCVLPYGEQSVNVARNAWLAAGLPESVPATTVDRQCGSGQQAVGFAAALIAAGTADLVVAGGVEHMSRVSFGAEEAQREELGTPWPRAVTDRHRLVPQGISAERVAERWRLDRERLDRVSVRSHRRASAATAAGAFADQLVPIEVDGRAVVADQGIRSETSVEALAGLPPAFEEGGRITAGNSSQISDGAAALVLASRERAEQLRLPVLGRIVDHLAVGSDPVLMLTGPVPATRALLERNGLATEEVGRFEVNEAFAAVLCMWEEEIGADPARVNVNGGAIALGHPLGASGARLLVDLLHELARSGEARGLLTMCCRGGLGTATLVEA